MRNILMGKKYLEIMNPDYFIHYLYTDNEYLYYRAFLRTEISGRYNFPSSVHIKIDDLKNLKNLLRKEKLKRILDERY
jgi:hypothetical protein